MRQEVVDLIALGALPSSKSDIPVIAAWQTALEKILPPTTDQEALALVSLFPDSDDDCFGLGWTLLHLVESAPGWRVQKPVKMPNNPWTVLLESRLANRNLR